MEKLKRIRKEIYSSKCFTDFKADESEDELGKNLEDNCTPDEIRSHLTDSKCIQKEYFNKTDTNIFHNYYYKYS